MRQKTMERLRSRVGESIAEVLVALLISAVGVALLVGMIAASTRIIDKSTQTMREEYNKTNVSEVSGKQTVTLVSGSTAIDSFKVRDQVHTASNTSGSSKTETIFYTPAQTTSSSNGSSTSGSGAS